MYRSQIPEQIRQLKEKFELSVLYLLFPSQKHVIPKYGAHLLLDAWRKRGALLGFPPFRLRDHFDYIYCRGYFAGRVGLSLRKRAKIIIDVRGLISEELKFDARLFGRFKSLFYRRLEAQLMKRADLLLVVSENFREYVKRRYKRANALPLRPFVNVHRFAYDPGLRAACRRELGFSADDIVLVYCGNLSEWQCHPATIRLFEELKQRETRLKMLFITRDKLENIPEKDFLVLDVANKEVPKYLNASDFGFLLRDDIVANHVAYPTKYSEYLLCGLPVIMTRNVGCLPDADPGNSLLVDLNRLDAGLLLAEMKQRKFDRQRISGDYKNKIFNKQLFDVLSSGTSETRG